MIFRRLRSLLDGAFFLTMNLRRFSSLPRFSECSLGNGMVVRECRPHEVRAVIVLRKQLDGYELSWPVQLLLRLVSEKCCVVVSDEHDSLNALSCFYFNSRDIRDETVHEGFIGVRPEHEGKGLATSIRQYGAEHFSRIGGLRGISSRISLSNSASVASARKVGYELLQLYRDAVTGDERGYFMKRFHCESSE